MTQSDFAVFVIAVVFGTLATIWATRQFDLRRENFRKERIPSMAGLVLVIGGVFFYAVKWLVDGVSTAGIAGSYLMVTFAFGALGMLDDTAGDRSVGGYGGHFSELRKGKLTTGMAKLIGGGAASLMAGFMMFYPLVWQALLAGLVIALTANTLNLLDVRPGRSLFGFFLGALSIVGMLWSHGHNSLGVGMLLYFAVAVALILFPLDASGQVMLGDTGSNVFGAILGVAFAVFLSVPWQIVLVVLLGAFQIWCEKNSFSQAIEKNPILRSLDRKIGVR